MAVQMSAFELNTVVNRDIVVLNYVVFQNYVMFFHFIMGIGVESNFTYFV